ncbi:hypothetical protein T484DRAFT_1808853 [Baffinella frigidus]|nr:hypothetical protein T484DRAFT_1808853 [Cryptophyta sp. CCMP2293]
MVVLGGGCSLMIEVASVDEVASAVSSSLLALLDHDEPAANEPSANERSANKPSANEPAANKPSVAHVRHVFSPRGVPRQVIE